MYIYLTASWEEKGKGDSLGGSRRMTRKFHQIILLTSISQLNTGLPIVNVIVPAEPPYLINMDETFDTAYSLAVVICVSVHPLLLIRTKYASGPPEQPTYTLPLTVTEEQYIGKTPAVRGFGFDGTPCDSMVIVNVPL